MAEDSPDGIAWLLELRHDDAALLGGLRHWAHLRMATEEAAIWVKGFSRDEIGDAAVRSIPAKKVWWSKDNLLFAEGSIVPSRKAPALLWVPIARGLPVSLPPMNHNYFGLHEGIRMDLERSDTGHEAAAMLVSLETLRPYLAGAPAVRLKPLTWALLDKRDALVVGTPLLPLPGAPLWCAGNFLIPAGCDFQWVELREALQSRIAPGPDALALWHPDGRYTLIPRQAVRPLSIGSFRQSTALIFGAAG